MASNNEPSKAFEPLFTSGKSAFLRLLGENGTGNDLNKYDLYFLHLKSMFQKVGQEEIEAMSAKSANDVQDCMAELLSIDNIGNSQRSTLRETLRVRFYSVQNTGGAESPAAHPVSDDQIDRTINLILRILLTINVSDNEFGLGRWITWADNADGAQSTLAEFVEKQITKQVEGEKPRPDRHIAFDKRFSAATLSKKRGIKTYITYDLRNHLSLNGKELLVYPLRRWLDLHKSSGKSLITEEIIDETLMSLQLLFPIGQRRANKKYLKSIKFDGKPGHDYPFDLLDPKIRLDDFHFWQDRLAEIYLIWLSPPTSEFQKFREDFKGWFSFWGAAVAIVVMTFVFGVLAITFAILAWKDANKGADELLDVVKELLDVVKKAAEASIAARNAPPATITVTAVRF